MWITLLDCVKGINVNNSEVELEKLWKTALGELEIVLSKGIFTTWFTRTVLDSADDGVFTVGVPSFFYRDWLTKNYLSTIIKALEKASNLPVKSLKIKVVSDDHFSKDILVKKRVIHTPVDNFEGEKEVIHQSFDNIYGHSFETFVVGSNSRLAHAAAVAVSEKPGKAYNPLFIYGPSGLGKTHLLRAIENRIREKFSKMKIIYLSSETFTNEFIDAIKSNTNSAFRRRFRDIDVLIVDDIQFIGGKEVTQEEFFHTFNHLHQNHKQVVLAADRVPRAIKGLEDRLVTRFEWGMMADISMPDLETRSAILQEKCREKHITVSEEILNLIAERVTSSIRELEGALNKALAAAEIRKVTLSPALVNQVLSSQKQTKHKTTMDQIIKAVTSFYQINRADLFGSGRHKEVIRPRQICMYLLRFEGGFSYSLIAEEMGGKDHTTIMYGCKCIEKAMVQDESIKNDLNLVREKLHQ